MISDLLHEFNTTPAASPAIPARAVDSRIFFDQYSWIYSWIIIVYFQNQVPFRTHYPESHRCNPHQILWHLRSVISQSLVRVDHGTAGVLHRLNDPPRSHAQIPGLTLDQPPLYLHGLISIKHNSRNRTSHVAACSLAKGFALTANARFLPTVFL
jgi:hypothetical protein